VNTYKHLFLLRGIYGRGVHFDSYLCVLWPEAYQAAGDCPEAMEALEALLRREVAAPESRALHYMSLRCRFNSDMKGPYIVTSEADAEFSLTPDWAAVLWERRAGNYDIGYIGD
jgi:hypothetical protein